MPVFLASEALHADKPALPSMPYGATVVVNQREERDAAECQKFCFADFSMGSHERPMPSFLKMRLSTSLTMTVM